MHCGHRTSVHCFQILSIYQLHRIEKCMCQCKLCTIFPGAFHIGVPLFYLADNDDDSHMFAPYCTWLIMMMIPLMFAPYFIWLIMMMIPTCMLPILLGWWEKRHHCQPSKIGRKPEESSSSLFCENVQFVKCIARCVYMSHYVVRSMARTGCKQLGSFVSIRYLLVNEVVSKSACQIVSKLVCQLGKQLVGWSVSRQIAGRYVCRLWLANMQVLSKQIGRQEDKQVGRQTGRQVGCQVGLFVGKQKCRQVEREGDKVGGRQGGKYLDRQVGK